MTEAEFDQLLALGEKQRIEYKGPGSASDSGFIARIARAVLAMSNRRTLALNKSDFDYVNARKERTWHIPFWSPARRAASAG